MVGRRNTRSRTPCNECLAFPELHKRMPNLASRGLFKLATAFAGTHAVSMPRSQWVPDT